MIKVIVKGDPEAADTAASKYGVKLQGHIFHPEYDQTFAACESHGLEPLKAWFQATPDLGVGSLLFYAPIPPR